LAAPDALISRALARDLSGSSDDRDTFDDADDGFPGAAEGEDDDFGDFGDFNDGAEAFPAAAPSMVRCFGAVSWSRLMSRDRLRHPCCAPTCR
jgi:hypothetical protein